MTALTKFDGTRVRRFTVREFHQLAGRAGRPGFDPDGHVWVQAPDHVIENARALARAGDDPKARRKATKARPPDGFVHYDEAAMQRLVTAHAGAARVAFRVTADLVAAVLSRPDGPAALKHLLRTNHDAEPRRRQHQRRAIAVYRSLEAAGVAERQRDEHGRCLGVRVGSLVEGDDERSALRFSAPLMTFAIEVIATLDRDDPAYVVDVVSVVESVLDDPRQVLFAQQNAARAAEVARLKAEGVPYEERIERLESITWPRPLADLLDACFATYRTTIRGSPQNRRRSRSCARCSSAATRFATFVRRYRLERSEGLVLRYLTDAWRTLDRSLPDDVYSPIARGRRRMARRADPGDRRHAARRVGAHRRSTQSTTISRPRRLAPLARGRPARGAPPCARPRSAGSNCSPHAGYASLADRSGWSEDRLAEAMAPYWAEYDASASTPTPARHSTSR